MNTPARISPTLLALLLSAGNPIQARMPEAPSPVTPAATVAGKPNLPKAWAAAPLTLIPVNARFAAWSGDMPGPRGNGAVVEPLRIQVEVPPGGAFRALLETPWDSPIELAVEQDAAWKLGIRFSKKDQRYSNSRKEQRLVRVSLAQAVRQSVPLHGSYAGETSMPIGGSWPYLVRFTRDWDVDAWRTARRKTAPDLAGLPEVAPETLSPVFVPPKPVNPDGPPLFGMAEVLLVVDATGHPCAVHPVAGDPVLRASLEDWAWQLAFAPGKGLPAQGAVKVPLRMAFM